MVIECIEHRRPWGTTSRQVHAKIQQYLACLNMPAPFETEPPAVYIPSVFEEVKLVCDRATNSVRVGMMISSQFRVSLESGKIMVYHVRNQNSDRLFLTIQKVEPCAQ